jgi:hypothetical protein
LVGLKFNPNPTIQKRNRFSDSKIGNKLKNSKKHCESNKMAMRKKCRQKQRLKIGKKTIYDFDELNEELFIRAFELEHRRKSGKEYTV